MSMMHKALLRLMEIEGREGTSRSMSVVYALAIGFIPVKEKAIWLMMNEMVPPSRLEAVKKKAWKKYERLSVCDSAKGPS